MLLPLSQRTLQEEQVNLVFLLCGQRRRLCSGPRRLLSSGAGACTFAQSKPDIWSWSELSQHSLGQVETFVVLALVDQFPGEHQLQIAILGIGLRPPSGKSRLPCRTSWRRGRYPPGPDSRAEPYRRPCRSSSGRWRWPGRPCSARDKWRPAAPGRCRDYFSRPTV